MKKVLNYFYLIVTACCTYTVSYAQRADSVVVLPQQAKLPADARQLGTLKIGDNALTTNCNYEDYIKEAKEKAAIMGGNLVQITKLVSPVFISKCYKIEANVYTCAHPPYADKKTIDTAHTGYALLYVYRFRDSLALEPNFDLHLNDDSVLCRVKSKTSKIIKLTDTGNITLWAKSGHREEVTLNVRPGQSYYLRCALKHGEMHLEPFMEIINNTQGTYEFNKLNKSHSVNKVGLDYLQQVH